MWPECLRSKEVKHEGWDYNHRIHIKICVLWQTLFVPALGDREDAARDGRPAVLSKDVCELPLRKDPVSISNMDKRKEKKISYVELWLPQALV